MAKEKKETMPEEEMAENQSQETPDQEMAEGADPQQTSEQMLRKHLKLKDGEDIHARALQHIKDLQDYKGKNEKVNQKLVEAFQNNPEYAQMTKEMLSGTPVHVAMARNFDMTALAPKEGDADYEDYQNAISDYKKSKAEKEKYLKDMDDNIKMSVKQVDEFAKENNLSDEEAEKFITEVDKLVSDMVAGKVTKEGLQTFYKGLKRDEDVAQAKEAGKVEGKNAKIEDLKEKGDSTKGDGLPTLEAQNIVKEQPTPEIDPWSKAIIEKNQRTKR